MRNKAKLAVVLGLALMAAYPMEASANQYTVSNGEREHYEETLRNLGYTDGVGHSVADIAKIAKDIIRANPSKLTDDPNVTPRYIKPICQNASGHTYEFGYGGIDIGSKDLIFNATYRGDNSKTFEKADFYPELYMYNATIANDLAHEMGHWYGNTDDYSMAEEDRADNYAMEFSEPLEYGSYAGQWLSYESAGSAGRNHKETYYDAQDALEYIEKASKGHIKFADMYKGQFSHIEFDGKTFLQENILSRDDYMSDNVYPVVRKDSEKWKDFVVDKVHNIQNINEAYNPSDTYHEVYVAAQIAFAIKYNVFDAKHTHVIDAWSFWHDGEAVTAENQQHHDTLSKWTVLYFDNPLNGGRKIVDLYPYTTEELSAKYDEFDALFKAAPSKGTAYVEWCKANRKALSTNMAIPFWYICHWFIH